MDEEDLTISMFSQSYHIYVIFLLGRFLESYKQKRRP
jgi:hypothetical protein